MRCGAAEPAVGVIVLAGHAGEVGMIHKGCKHTAVMSS
jgi:hypothetical protein